MNKKFFLQLLVVIFIGGFSGSVIGHYINEKRDYREFEFRGGVRHSGGGYTRSVSHVLINKKNYNIDDLYSEIYDQFTLMNGTHDEITFYLYDSLEDLHNSESFSEKTYIKSPD